MEIGLTELMYPHQELLEKWTVTSLEGIITVIKFLSKNKGKVANQQDVSVAQCLKFSNRNVIHILPN